MHPIKCTHTLPSLQIPRSPSNFSLTFWDPNLLGALHVENDLLWHPNAFGLIVGLLVHLDGHHLVIFLLLLQEIRCGGLFVHLVGVGVGDLACFLLLFLLCSSPIDRLSSAVLRGVSHEGRLIGRGARDQEQEGNRDTRVRQVQAVSMT